MTDESALIGYLPPPHHVVHTYDAPAANGRKPKAGEQQWRFQFRLDDGTDLQVVLGRACRDAFRSFLLQEEADDAAERLLGPGL